MSSDATRLRRRRAVIVGVSLAVLTVAHFSAPAEDHSLHDLLFKVTFLPLILAGLWFGLRDALIWSGVVTGAYLVHVFTQLHGAHQPVWAWMGDLALYNVVTFTTALLSSRRAEALARAEAQARELETQARALLQAEELVRRGERHRSLGELAAGMAHEIRNPLGGIRGAGEVLRKPETSEAARQEFGQLLETEIARLDHVVANFLEFARPPAPELGPVGVGEVIDAVLLLTRGEARARGIELTRSAGAGTSARADADLLRQILLNLTLNALQAPGPPRAVRIEAERAEQRVVIRVRDDGSGVPDAIRDRLFDPYVTGRADGSGLGLAIASRLAASLDGELTLEASGPEGAVFRLELPAAR